MNVFVTGATGYIGRPLVRALLGRGHVVRALVRPGSERKLPAGAETISGDPLKRMSFAYRVAPSDTLVQLVGVPHPSPLKAAQFRAVDLVSACASIEAAADAGVRHFVYVSVAHPAPVMKAYIEVRRTAERALVASGLNATILRPFYVLGPGHWWPYGLLPLYWLFERIPALREGARRLRPVTLAQITSALVQAVEHPAEGIRIVEAPEISGRLPPDRALCPGQPVAQPTPRRQGAAASPGSSTE